MATILMAASAAGALVYSLCVCSARECVPVLNHAESPATAIEKRAFRVCTLGKDCRAKGVELDTKERRESAPEKQEHLSPEPLLPCYSTNWKAAHWCKTIYSSAAKNLWLIIILRLSFLYFALCKNLLIYSLKNFMRYLYSSTWRKRQTGKLVTGDGAREAICLGFIPRARIAQLLILCAPED
jgi:hypothetical protein